ncbi:MAG: hypothetical protein O3C27_06950, partial [Actinomycetota bacterium]|nr:hypothetical protein [Actinomycetota bacterium]
MKLASFEALWGLEGSLEEQLDGVKGRGYDGVEGGVPHFLARLGVIRQDEVADFPHVLADSGLLYIPMVFTYDSLLSNRWDGVVFDDGLSHADSFKAQVDDAMKYDPVQITSHSGSDAMDLAAAVEFFEMALEVERDTGVKIGHETHRWRILFSPFAWRDIHRELPDVRTVADLSHWVNVCERLPVDLVEELDSCIASSIHIHARVGHPEGPQVNDPRAPENDRFVAWHEDAWRRVLEHRRDDAPDLVTYNPEYGPAPYLPSTPYDQRPLADLNQVRLWTRERVERT